jgi:hypothetical protein
MRASSSGCALAHRAGRVAGDEADVGTVVDEIDPAGATKTLAIKLKSTARTRLRAQAPEGSCDPRALWREEPDARDHPGAHAEDPLTRPTPRPAKPGSRPRRRPAGGTTRREGLRTGRRALLAPRRPDANVVFAYDELAARIVAQVARQRDKQDFVALGLGGSPAGVAAVKSGLLTVMYGQGEFQSGYAAGRLLDRLRKGQAVKPEVIPYQRLTKDNLNTYVNSDQLCRKATGS